MATVASLPLGCSGMQTSSLAPAAHEAPVQQIVALNGLGSQKCQSSRHFKVVPCHLTLTSKQEKEVYVEGGGSGIVRLFNNCAGVAKLGNESGTIFIVKPEKAESTCAAVFTYRDEFAILAIRNDV